MVLIIPVLPVHSLIFYKKRWQLLPYQFKAPDTIIF